MSLGGFDLYNMIGIVTLAWAWIALAIPLLVIAAAWQKRRRPVDFRP